MAQWASSILEAQGAGRQRWQHQGSPRTKPYPGSWTGRNLAAFLAMVQDRDREPMGPQPYGFSLAFCQA